MAQQTDKPQRLLILDFDGVVVETEPVHFASWNRAFDELLGLRIGGDHRQLVGLSLQGIFDLWTRADGSPQPDAPAPLDEATRRRLLARKTELFFELGQERLTPMPGLLPLIQHAHAHNWYVTIVSRALRRRLLGTLRLLGLPAQFDLILGYEDAVDPATDSKRHDWAGLPFGIEPARCLVIEDSPSGVRAARACGIGQVLGLTSSLPPEALWQAGAHEVIHSLAEARQFIE